MREKERGGVPIRPFQKLPPPFDLNEHHNMHRSLKIPIAIYEKEPTSLIAYALSSREYAQEYWALVERRPVILQPTERLLSRPSSPKVPKKQVDPSLVQLPPPTKTSALKQAYQELRKKGPLNAMNVFSGLSVASDRPEPHDRSGDDSRRIEAALSSKSSHSSSSTPSKSSQTNSSSFPATDQSALQEDGEGFRWNATGEHASTGSSCKGGHISLEFTAPDRTSSIFCKVYFAEEFQHLRELVFPSGEDRFIRSLSRCVKFDAKGGKSRSTFCKVIDDRFIMKQIKAVEISSFEQIAPLYFDHITSALESKRPLALAKILGAYTIGYRNTRTGNSKRLDVIVMENLLYGRKSSKVVQH
jgi:1-phosphatidylinositol-3-phosphate 5-kinase